MPVQVFFLPYVLLLSLSVLLHCLLTMFVLFACSPTTFLGFPSWLSPVLSLHVAVLPLQNVLPLCTITHCFFRFPFAITHLHACTYPALVCLDDVLQCCCWHYGVILSHFTSVTVMPSARQQAQWRHQLSENCSMLHSVHSKQVHVFMCSLEFAPFACWCHGPSPHVILWVFLFASHLEFLFLMSSLLFSCCVYVPPLRCANSSWF